jgi:hypothetical protein
MDKTRVFVDNKRLKRCAQEPCFHATKLYCKEIEPRVLAMSTRFAHPLLTLCEISLKTLLESGVVSKEHTLPERTLKMNLHTCSGITCM